MQYTAHEIVCQEGDVLHDISGSGRENPWAQHKLQAQLIAGAMWEQFPPIANRMNNCADRLTFVKDWQDEKNPGKLRLATAYFCRARLCPVCQWRRSLKMGGQTAAAVQWIDRHDPKKYVLLTLTVKNCRPEQLAATLNQLQGGWQRLIQRKQVATVVKGFIRAVEITYNRTENTFHPHIHALLAVNPSYFTSRGYINQATWRDLWRTAARLNYDPSVDIRKAKAKGGEIADDIRNPKDLGGAIAEVTKYATKPADYIMPQDVGQMQEVLSALQNACAKRRFASWGGCFKAAHAALGLDDCEDGDLIHTGLDLDGLSDAGAALWTYDWYCGPKLYIASEKGVPV